MSPGFTASPGFTSHLASVPFSIVGESAGIVSSIAISVSKKEFGGGIDDRVGIQPVGAVKIGQIAGLAKTIGAKRRNAHARHTTQPRSEEHTSELQSLMRISYAVFCLKKKIKSISYTSTHFPPPASYPQL